MTWLRPRRVPDDLDGPRGDPNRRPAVMPVTLPALPVPVTQVPPRVLPAVPLAAVIPPGGETLALPANARRAYVLFGVTVGSLNYYARPGAQPVGMGIAFRQGGTQLFLTKEDLGELICEPWYLGEASGVPAPPDIYVVEGYYP